MKTKHFCIKTLIFILIGSLFLSCSKFEEGPYFSLLSVKQRLSRQWKIEFSRNLETGIEHSADFEGWVLSFDKGGSFSKTVIYGLTRIEYNGNWEIIGKNQVRFDFSVSSGNISEFWTILRLTKKELWLKDSKEEVHYYSD